MQGVLILNGIKYNLNILDLKRKFAVTDTENSGRVADYSMHRDIIGTFYNYTLKVAPFYEDTGSYNAFYEVITNPNLSEHTIELPFADETLTFTAYITQGEDSLKIRKGRNLWGYDGLSVNFIATEPQRRR